MSMVAPAVTPTRMPCPCRSRRLHATVDDMDTTVDEALASRIAELVVERLRGLDPLPARLKVPEAARLAGMTPRALWHMIQRALLPHGAVIRVGRSVYLDRERFHNAIRKSRPGRSR